MAMCFCVGFNIVKNTGGEEMVVTIINFGVLQLLIGVIF